MAQVNMGDNKIVILSRKARNWIFTLNNYTENNVAQILALKANPKLKILVFQEEIGENGTPHLQGVLAYENAVSFSSVKKILPRAHWEKCRSLKASLAYCSKEDTRNGKLYTHNYIPFNNGKRLTTEDILQEMLAQRLATLHE